MEEPKYCPRCGAKLEKKLVGDKIRYVCPKCGYVFYLNPVVAAGALVEVDGKVALVKRGVEPGKGLWALPSGYVEADETAEDAAARETREEIGLEVKVEDLLGVYSFGSPGEQHGVLILYSAKKIGGELRAGDDAQDVRLFAPHELPMDKIAFETSKMALREWLRARMMVYKPATEAEAREAEELYKRYEGKDCDFVSLATSSGSELLVAMDQGSVVGVCGIRLEKHIDSALITKLFVKPNYRRWGIGSRLLREAMGWARDKSVALVRAEAGATNPGIVVYLKAGFRVCGFLEYPMLQPEPEPGAFLQLCHAV